MKGFYHIWVLRPSWSYEPDPVNKLLFPHPTEAPYEILALIGQAVLEKKIFENGGQQRTDHGYTISSPMSLKAPDGELKMIFLSSKFCC